MSIPINSIAKFSGKAQDFDNWKFNATIALKAYKLYKFVETKLEDIKGTDAPDLEGQTAALILNSLEEKLARNILAAGITSACGIWLHLNEKFSIIGIRLIINHIRKIFSTKPQFNDFESFDNNFTLDMGTFETLTNGNKEKVRIAFYLLHMPDTIIEYVHARYNEKEHKCSDIQQMVCSYVQNTAASYNYKPDTSSDLTNVSFTAKKHYNKKKPTHKFQTKSTEETKWCEYHKSTSHDTQECRSKNRKPAVRLATHDSDSYNNEDRSVAFMATTVKPNHKPWILDSGSSDHLTSDRSLFQDLIECHGDIKIADSNTMEYIGKGTITLLTSTSNNSIIKIKVHNVLYVPKADCNLLSASALARNKHQILLGDSNSQILLSNGSTIDLIRQKGMWLLQTVPNNEPNNTMLLHKAMGHPSKEVLVKIPGAKRNEIEDCDPCDISKMKHSKFPKKAHIKADKPLKLIHSDIIGKITPTSIIDKSEYAVTFTDDHSGYIWLYPMEKKSDLLDKFMQLQADAAPHGDVKIIRSDNGGEYKSKIFADHCKSRKIRQEYTIPYTPQQNGRSERNQQSVVTIARTIMTDSKVNKGLWPKALQYATYVHNLTPSPNNGGKSPYEILHGKKPDLSQLHVFGCKVFAKLNTSGGKFDDRAVEGIFVGYALNNKAYEVYVPGKGIMLTRTASFRDRTPQHELFFNNEVATPDTTQEEPDVIHPVNSDDNEEQEEDTPNLIPIKSSVTPITSTTSPAKLNLNNPKPSKSTWSKNWKNPTVFNGRTRSQNKQNDDPHTYHSVTLMAINTTPQTYEEA